MNKRIILLSLTFLLATIMVNFLEKGYAGKGIIYILGTQPYLPRDGSLPMTSDLNMGGNSIINLSEPINDSDAATKYYVDSLISGLEITYFFTNQSADVAGYYIMDPTSLEQFTIELGPFDTGDDQFVIGFITNDTVIPRILHKGVHLAHILAYKSGTKPVEIYWRLYERLENGTEILIMTSETSALLTQDRQAFDLPAVLDTDYFLTNGSELVLKIFANVGQTGSNVYIYLETGTESNSYFSVKVPTLEFTDIFVPYTGAKKDVDLGNHTLNASSISTNELCLGGDCQTSWPAGGIQGSGTTNYIPVFVDNVTIGNSVIYEKNNGEYVYVDAGLEYGYNKDASLVNIYDSIGISRGSMDMVQFNGQLYVAYGQYIVKFDGKTASIFLSDSYSIYDLEEWRGSLCYTRYETADYYTVKCYTPTKGWKTLTTPSKQARYLAVWDDKLCVAFDYGGGSIYCYDGSSWEYVYGGHAYSMTVWNGKLCFGLSNKNVYCYDGKQVTNLGHPSYYYYPYDLVVWNGLLCDASYYVSCYDGTTWRTIAINYQSRYIRDLEVWNGLLWFIDQGGGIGYYDGNKLYYLKDTGTGPSDNGVMTIWNGKLCYIDQFSNIWCFTDSRYKNGNWERKGNNIYYYGNIYADTVGVMGKALLGYKIVTNSSTNSVLQVYCDSLYKAVSGGCYCPGSSIVKSAPLADGSGWDCECSASGSNEAYAICMRVG